MSAACQDETAVTDAPWALLHPRLPTPIWTPGSRGRPPRPLRRVVKGIVSVHKTGCPWRMLPKEFGPWETVYGYLRRWRRAGVWERVMTAWRHLERRCQGRLAEPSAGASDSQSVKTATQSQDVGFDRHKTITGRQRHLWVDTLGLSVAVGVTAAHGAEREGLVALLHHYFADGVTRWRKLWVDGGSRAAWLHAWVWGLKRTHKMDVEVVEQTGKGCRVVPQRWVVERTFAWLLN
jgi:putative transposase